MIDRLILANGALLVATTLATLACVQPGAHGARALTTPASVVAGRTPAIHGPEVGVRLDEVDLSTPDGARALLARIRSAAKTLCAAANHGDERLQGECVRETTDQAVAELCNPAVAAANAASSRTRD